ncbi:MAG: hypothetical protein GF398_07270 [Chitinivibrionales bacterium]|nr:hypothetical protein [Chitinivibrionales bacterium]
MISLPRSLPEFTAYPQQHSRTSPNVNQRDAHQPAPAGNRVQAVMTAQYYRSDSLTVEFESKDGDTVTLNYEHIEYQKKMSAISADNLSREERDTIVQRIANEFHAMKKGMLNSFLKSLGFDTGQTQQPSETGAQGEIAEVPEYWNAENTSQRIVDFAVSFYDAFEGAGEEFVSIIKGAVEDGFEQAREILGELPDAVNNLVGNTYDLVMEKLDTWSAEQGIGENPHESVSPETQSVA